MFLPEASRVERLSALQTSCQVLKVIRKLLVLPELNHIIEVLHMLDDCVQLENRRRGGVSTIFRITVRAGVQTGGDCEDAPLLAPTYLFVLFVALKCGDRVLVQVSGDAHTLSNLRRRGRSLEDAIIFLSVGRFFTGSTC